MSCAGEHWQVDLLQNWKLRSFAIMVKCAFVVSVATTITPLTHKELRRMVSMVGVPQDVSDVIWVHT
jgi:hypothetical protein